MGIYKWVLPRDYSYHTGVVPDFGAAAIGSVSFADERGKYWLSIDVEGKVTVYAGYAWDGCSPKFRVFGWLLGTPDGDVNPNTGYPSSYHASLLHDVLYQFLDDPRMPYTREQADEVFHRALVAHGFSVPWLYWKAVRLFGGVFRKAAFLIK